MGKDHTIFATKYGKVRFAMGKQRTNWQFIHVDPIVSSEKVEQLLRGTIREVKAVKELY